MGTFSRSRRRSLISIDRRISSSLRIDSLLISRPRSTLSPSVHRQNWRRSGSWLDFVSSLYIKETEGGNGAAFRLTSVLDGAMKFRLYSSTSYVMLNARSRTSYRESAVRHSPVHTYYQSLPVTRIIVKQKEAREHQRHPSVLGWGLHAGETTSLTWPGNASAWPQIPWVREVLCPSMDLHLISLSHV